jgi:hypothetical protein
LIHGHRRIAWERVERSATGPEAMHEILHGRPRRHVDPQLGHAHDIPVHGEEEGPDLQRTRSF